MEGIRPKTKKVRHVNMIEVRTETQKKRQVMMKGIRPDKELEGDEDGKDQG